MILRFIHRYLWLSLVLLIIVSIMSAFAAANTVMQSSVDDDVRSITANDLRPPECGTINLVNVVTGSVNIQGTNSNDLILGSADGDKINAKKGNDCIVSGGGDDELRGGDGDDVLLAGPGNDELKGEDDVDTCYGGDGTDTTDGTCESSFGIP